MEYFDKIQETAAYIRKRTTLRPAVGLVLGSGLGTLSSIIETDCTLDYSLLPHFPQSTVKGHGGKLIIGRLGNCPVVALSGRFHYYEGYSMKEVTFPVRVMKALGIDTLMLSNAAGGLHPDYEVGDIMLLEDHINLMPSNPLIGKNDDRLGPRFPDMSEPYSRSLLGIARQVAGSNQIKIHTGIYAGVPGPCFETRAEYKYLHTLGADAVGMSTVPETIAAIHSGLQVMAASVITDLGIREEANTITHEEVLEAAGVAAPKMALIFKETIAQLTTPDNA